MINRKQRFGLGEKTVNCLNAPLCFKWCMNHNLPPSVLFSVDLFFRHKRTTNIMGIVAGNPWVHYIKTVPFYSVLIHLFREQSCDRIEPPCLFCLLTFFKLARCSRPDLTWLKTQKFMKTQQKKQKWEGKDNYNCYMTWWTENSGNSTVNGVDYIST